MIGLRVAHLMPALRPTAATSGMLHVCRWLRAHDHQALVVTEGGVRADDFQDAGLALHSYQGGGPGWWLRGRGRLVRDLTDWQPDLLHVHHRDAIPLGAYLGERLRVPVVAHVHRVMDEDTARHLRDPAIALVLVPTAALRAHYVSRLGLDRDRVAVLPYALDLTRFSPAGDWQEPPVIGAVGNWREAETGADVVIAALSRLQRPDRPVRGLLVGSGGTELAERIEAAGLTEVVTLQDAGARVAPHLARMDMFAYSVTDDRCHLALLKAMACGLPVVASAVGGVIEQIDDGETGRLVPPGDVDALVAALEAWLDDRAHAREIGAAAREQLEADHAFEMVGETVHDYYRSVLSGSGVASGTEVAAAMRRATSDGRSGSSSGDDDDLN